MMACGTVRVGFFASSAIFDAVSKTTTVEANGSRTPEPVGKAVIVPGFWASYGQRSRPRSVTFSNDVGTGWRAPPIST
jgi:hypothetical protein